MHYAHFPSQHLQSMFFNVNLSCEGQYASIICQSPLIIYCVKWQVKCHLNHNIQLCYIHGVVHAQWWLRGTLFPRALNTFITISKSWVQEVFDAIVLGTTSIVGIGWKEEGGVTRVDWGGIRGFLIRIRGTIVGGEQVSIGANGFANADPSNQYESTLSVRFLGMVLQLT
jgi:hypothetical protein